MVSRSWALLTARNGGAEVDYSGGRDRTMVDTVAGDQS